MLRKNSLGKATNISDLSDIDFSTSPTNNDILSYDSTVLKWLPKAPPSTSQVTGVSIYVIELLRWGIIQGLPSKRLETIGGVNVNCYSDADYITAYNNSIGLNNAMTWAYANGYRQVTVPFGNYSVCYSNISDNDKENCIVINFNNFTLDLNGSTFKVIYDSGKRSPYDKTKVGTTYQVSTSDIFMFGNSNNGVIKIRDCSYTTLRNGKLIGCKVDRDFSVQKEKSNEWSYGVNAGGNGEYNTVEYMDVGFFMGDGVTCSTGKQNIFIKNGYDLAWQLGNIDSNGAFTTSTNRCVSSYISVSPSTPHYLQGYGSTQGMSALKNKKYTVYFYDVNKVYINDPQTAFVLQDFITTKFTAFIRIVVEESAVDVNGWQMKLQTGYHGNYMTYQNNRIHHNHRGGMTIGVNDMFILNNHFYNNGELFDYVNMLPGVETEAGTPWSTRYHINMEDSQGFNCHIIGNKFENGRLGIAVRGYNFVIKDNWFKDNTGIILYRVHYASVKDNFFDNSSFDTYQYDSAYNDLTDYYRHWNIEGNVIDGKLTINGTAVVSSISNNVITGEVNIASNVDNFKGNTFKVNSDIGFADTISLKTVSLIDSCKFIKNTQSTANNSILLYDTVIRNCTFNNLKVRVKNVILKDCVITDSGFELKDDTSFKMHNCKISQGIYLLKNNYMVTPDNSALIVIQDVTKTINAEFKDCEINSSSTQAIFGSNGGFSTNSNLKLENTKITKTANNKLGLGIFNGTLNFINTTISSEIAVPNITPNASLVHRFLDCTFTNVSFTVKTTDIKYSQQDIGLMARPLIGSVAPSTIPTKVGQEYYDLTNKKLYKAFGTSSSTDWIIMN